MREYSQELFRATCEDKLAQHVDLLRVELNDLGECEPVVIQGNDPSTLVEPTITHFKIMGDSQGSGLLHAYGDMVELIASHFRKGELQGYAGGLASARAEYVLEAMEEAAKEVGLTPPRSVQLRVDRLQEMLLKSMWPEELCRGGVNRSVMMRRHTTEPLCTPVNIENGRVMRCCT